MSLFCSITIRPHPILPFFFFNDTATTEIYTLSLHDALPISSTATQSGWTRSMTSPTRSTIAWMRCGRSRRSEEHTSELQSRLHLVCRLLLEKKKNKRRRLSEVVRRYRAVGTDAEADR